MPVRRLPALRTLLAPCLALALGLSACGGSGGGGSVSPSTLEHPYALLQGTYHVAGMRGEQQGVETVASYWGSATADGTGLTSLTLSMNEVGNLIGPLPSGDLPYSVGFDRVLEFHTGLPGLPVLRGGITETGDVALATTVMAEVQPMLLLFGRQGGTYDDASLAGTYHFASYGAVVAGPTNFAGWGTFTFDGAGGGSYELSMNHEGVVFGPANPLLTYDVAADGSVSIDLGGFVVTGSITAGGEMVLASGGQAAGANPTTYVLLRQGAGHADADLEGPYFMLGFLHDPATNAYSTFSGAMLADGAGVNDFGGTRNEDGFVTQEALESLLSAVAPDGTVTFTTPGGDTLHGGMSADRRFVVAGGMDNAGGTPAFFFLLR